MRRSAFSAILIGLAIALPGTANAENWKRIKTEAVYNAMVAGKKVVFDWGWITAKKNGQITGKHNKAGKVKGAWNWQKGFWCRNVIFGKKQLEPDCQLVQMSGKKFRTIGRQGKGEPGSVGVVN